MQQWNESFPDWEGARELSSLFGEDLLMDPQEILLTARVALGRAGVRLSGFQTEAGQAVATAEAVNWAAKVVTPAFYTVKETVWVAARKVAGVQGGLGHDGCFFLFAEEVGVACAHFVDDGVSDWDHPWSGVRRQEWAFHLAQDREVRRLLTYATSPGHPPAGGWVDRAMRRLGY
jgi:hypothetical protein